MVFPVVVEPGRFVVVEDGLFVVTDGRLTVVIPVDWFPFVEGVLVLSVFLSSFRVVPSTPSPSSGSGSSPSGVISSSV